MKSECCVEDEKKYESVSLVCSLSICVSSALGDRNLLNIATTGTGVTMVEMKAVMASVAKYPTKCVS